MMKFIIVLSVLLITSISVFGQDGLTRDLQNSLRRYELVKMSPKDLNGRARAGQKIRLKAYGRDFEFDLTPHDIRAANYRAVETNVNGNYEMPVGEVKTFAGKLSDDPTSEIRFLVDDHRIDGMIYTGTTKFFITRAEKFSKNAKADDVVVYREEDAIVNLDLGDDIVGRTGKESGSAVPDMGYAITADLKEIEVATEADNQWVTQAGGASAANTEILGILNLVDGIYKRDLNLSIKVTYQHAWSSSDPFTSSSFSSLLDSFVSYWNSNFPRSQYPRDTAHLFTGKFSGQGLAYIGVICQYANFAYGQTARSGSVNHLITAHEIGHNLGAEHVDNSGSCANSMMNPILSYAVTSFCQTSKDAIASYVASFGSCLTVITGSPTPTPTPSITPTPTPIPTPTATPTPNPTPTATPFPTPFPTPNPTLRKLFDFDGDGRADPGVFRPSDGNFYVLGTTRGAVTTSMGQAGDQVVSEDYDGDGRTDLAIYRNGTWYVTYSSGGGTTVNWGTTGDIPQPADRNGDGRAEFIVFRPSTGTWYSLNGGTGAYEAVNWGSNADKPVIGDFDGDGRADFAVWRPSTGIWYILRASGGYDVYQWGASTDVAIPADYNGDGRTDLGIYRNGTWFINFVSSYTVVQWGVLGDSPVAADYDGDGRADVAVWRSSSGNWFILKSSGGYDIIQWGLVGDVPIPNYKAK